MAMQQEDLCYFTNLAKEALLVYKINNRIKRQTDQFKVNACNNYAGDNMHKCRGDVDLKSKTSSSINFSINFFITHENQSCPSTWLSRTVGICL